jgi:hypothetical protein
MKGMGRQSGYGDLHPSLNGANAGLAELVVLSTKKNAARCRPLASGDLVTLRAGRWGDLVPGEIAVVATGKQWRYAGHPYMSGDIESVRLDVAALGLTPLRLDDCDTWDPSEHYWGGDDELIPNWAMPIIARGPRPQFEMEQIIPGGRGEDDIDPISDAVELTEEGDGDGARKILMGLCETDLRCLDAHAHLGNLVFDYWPELAIRHYQVGVSIGELPLGQKFDGLLPWGYIDNRPFLRCLQSFGLCLWRLGRFEQAEVIFQRMLWLNPSDNQGIRFLIGNVRSKTAWETCQESES